jgi:hypothetical protein
MPNQLLNRIRLNRSRKEQSVINDAKNIAEDAITSGPFSYFFQMNFFTDWMFGAAIFAALLKDILDPIEVTGALFVLIFILTICTSIFIGLMMVLGSFATGTGRGKSTVIKRFLTLLGGTIAEFIPGLNFLPIETLTAIWIYLIVLSARKQQEKESEA